MPVGQQGIANLYQKPLGYVQQTSLGSAVNLSSIPARATMCVITVEGNGIRWRDDGSDPTASVGMPVSNGQTFSYTGNMNALRIIQQAASATINVTYYA